MNHRPFEDWLLDDQPLTPQQKRDLQSHVLNCSSCAAIAESNLALHTTRRLQPAAGFTERFQTRLAVRRREQRWQQIIGTLVLVLGGLGLLYWLAGPLILEAFSSPAAWLTAAVSYFLFILTSIQVMGEVSTIVLRIVPNFIPPAILILVASIGCGLGLLWVNSILRSARTTQGV
jgi:hypothetical protein